MAGVKGRSGRKPGTRTPDEVRTKIQATKVLQRLTQHVLSPRPGIMDNSQVNAARILLNKIIPDVSNVQLAGNDRGMPSIQIEFVTKAEKVIEGAQFTVIPGGRDDRVLEMVDAQRRDADDAEYAEQSVDGGEGEDS